MSSTDILDQPNSKNSALTPAQKRLDDLETLKQIEKAGALVMAARNEARKGARTQAYELIKQAFAAHAGDVTAIELLGDLYLEDGETEKALALYERALQAHPKHAVFEEKLAICRLDLAEIEADKIIANTPFSLDAPSNKWEERQPVKAVSLSVFLPGAGQFYNEQVEKGAIFLAAALLSCIGWFYLLWTQLSKLPLNQRLDFATGLANLSGLGRGVFWLCLAVWTLVYFVSLIDAGVTASRFNLEQRRARGLEV